MHKYTNAQMQASTHSCINFPHTCIGTRQCLVNQLLCLQLHPHIIAIRNINAAKTPFCMTLQHLLDALAWRLVLHVCYLLFQTYHYSQRRTLRRQPVHGQGLGHNVACADIRTDGPCRATLRQRMKTHRDGCGCGKWDLSAVRRLRWIIKQVRICCWASKVNINALVCATRWQYGGGKLIARYAFYLS